MTFICQRCLHNGLCQNQGTLYDLVYNQGQNVSCMRFLDAEKVKTALEKQTPKKLIFRAEKDKYYNPYICPNCNMILLQAPNSKIDKEYDTAEHYCEKFWKHNNCAYCGQALDWSREYDNSEHCTACGETIPEGRQLCPSCENGGDT